VDQPLYVFALKAKETCVSLRWRKRYFLQGRKNERRRERERERERRREKEKKIVVKTTRPSRPFPRNPHAVSFYRSRHRTVLKIRERRRVSSGESQSVSQSIGKRACACSGKFVANSVLSGSVEKLSNVQKIFSIIDRGYVPRYPDLKTCNKD